MVAPMPMPMPMPIRPPLFPAPGLGGARTPVLPPEPMAAGCRPPLSIRIGALPWDPLGRNDVLPPKASQQQFCPPADVVPPAGQPPPPIGPAPEDALPPDDVLRPPCPDHPPWYYMPRQDAFSKAIDALIANHPPPIQFPTNWEDNLTADGPNGSASAGSIEDCESP